MGTGKTAVGKELAKRKKWHFVDLDELIELRAGRRICDIFAKDGEEYFRRLERRVLKEVAKEKKFTVACGGGVVINPDNIKTMREAGDIICLSASVDVILERTRGCLDRPLLNVANPRQQIEHLLKIRAPFYARADKIIDTSKKSVKEVVAAIAKITKTKK